MRGTKLTEEPFCVFCDKMGLKMPAEVVDHVKPHRGDLELFFDYDNLQSLCKPHHDGDKQRMEKGSIVIQYGPDGFPLPIGG